MLFQLADGLAQRLGWVFGGGHAQQRQGDRRLVRRPGQQRLFQCGEVGKLGDFQAAVFQLVVQRGAGQFMGLVQRHAQAAGHGGRQVVAVVAGLGQVEADPEFRTVAGAAFHADLATHLLDQALGDHQPQASAAGLARERVVGLAEGLEQRAQVGVGQPHAGVLHADAQLRAVVAFVLEHGAYGDAAVVGELDGVAHQVGQHLFQALRVAHQLQRGVAVDQADQLQVLLVGGGGEDGQGVLDQLAQVERDVLQHQLAGLDLREVEDLVDDPQQAFGGLVDGAQVVLLARGHLALLQQVGETEDAIERGADLVAHVGEELGLDPARFQGFLARQVQFDVLDLDGLQVLPDVLGGLVDVVLHFFLGALQRLGHAVDAAGQFIQFVAAQGGQAGFQAAFLELGDALGDLPQRRIDRAAHAQGEQGGDGKPGADQQQAGEQAAVAAQQGAVVRQLQLDPAQQLLGVIVGVAGEAAVLAQHRQEEVGGVQVAGHAQVRAVAGRNGGEDAGAGVDQFFPVRVEEGHGAYVRLVQRLVGDAFEQLVVVVGHGRGRQRCQLLGDQLPALDQLGVHVRQLHPGEIAAQHQRQQAGGQQGEQQYPSLDAEILEHALPPMRLSPAV